MYYISNFSFVFFDRFKVYILLFLYNIYEYK